MTLFPSLSSTNGGTTHLLGYMPERYATTTPVFHIQVSYLVSMLSLFSSLLHISQVQSDSVDTTKKTIDNEKGLDRVSA
jgi:hypothetical protein